MPPLKNLLFSSKGRISRSSFWYGVFLVKPILFGILFIASGGLPFIGGNSFIRGNSFIGGNSLITIIITFALILIISASLYASFCLYIKRLHDFNKTGWLSLLTLIPLPYLGILVIIVFGSVKGTVGANNYDSKLLVLDKAV